MEIRYWDPTLNGLLSRTLQDLAAARVDRRSPLCRPGCPSETIVNGSRTSGPPGSATKLAIRNSKLFRI
jgi:hypothetical protein